MWTFFSMWNLSILHFVLSLLYYWKYRKVSRHREFFYSWYRLNRSGGLWYITLSQKVLLADLQAVSGNPRLFAPFPEMSHIKGHHAKCAVDRPQIDRNRSSFMTDLLNLFLSCCDVSLYSSTGNGWETCLLNAHFPIGWSGCLFCLVSFPVCVLILLDGCWYVWQNIMSVQMSFLDSWL